MHLLIMSIIYNKTYLTSPPNKSSKYANLYILYVKYRCVDQVCTYSCDPGQMPYNIDNKQCVAYTILQIHKRGKCTKYETCAILHRFHILYGKCTKYETCAILHRFHILYISRECNSKTEQT